ncbi:MAG: GNAT family N-acetyltransferase [Candidatus Cloacimonetes bacterium]|nr:GNAT family N-acetyltransferase [Candidatus Cloacimonadota bacterium]
MNNEIRYLQYDPNYRNSLLQLFKEMFGFADLKQAEQKFVWRYEDNYCLQAHNVYIAVIGDKVVGFRGFAAQRFLFADKPRVVLTPSDAVVHPDFRRQGIFNKLTEYAMQVLSEKYDELDLSVYLNLSSNKKSAPGNLKLGWQVFAEKEWMTRICLLAIIKNLFSRNAGVKKLESKGKSRFKLSVSDSIDAAVIRSIDHFISYQIIREQSDEYYKWRYADAKRISFVALYDEGRPAAYAIIEQHSGIKYSIMEYAAETIPALKMLIKKAIRYHNIGVLRVLMMGGAPSERKAFRKLGFVADSKLISRIRNKEKTPVLIKGVLQDDEGSTINGIDWQNPEAWRIQKSDVH